MMVSESLVAEGRLGIVDAGLVRYFESLKKEARTVGVRVTESLYAPLVTREHLDAFLSALTVVDWVASQDADRDMHVPRGCLTGGSCPVVPFPEDELREYTTVRMLKYVDVWSEPRPAFGGKHCPIEELADLYRRGRRIGRLAVVAGSFDVIHVGHVALMQLARNMADVLIVASQSTNSIRQQPKNVRNDLPIYGEADRLSVLAALRCVDHVVLFDELDCLRTLELLCPDLYVKHERDRGRDIVAAEADLVTGMGGQTVYVDAQEHGHTSGTIIQAVRRRVEAREGGAANEEVR